MARSINSMKGAATLEARRMAERARRRLVPLGMETTFAAQHGEAREVAIRVAAGSTPNAATVDADFPMLKRVRAELGMQGVSNRAAAWLARYNALADVARAEPVALAAIRNADNGAAILTALATLRADLITAVAGA